ncbi:MAG: cytochrome c maturation protein CcmE [Chloroflexi bacterium]|nr:cytochrome c maturation protein CcmE [Chloroflexota bacterium]
MKPKFIVGIVIIFVAMFAVMGFAIAGNSNLEVKVNDVVAQQAQGADLTQRALKLTGIVVGDSIAYDPARLHLEFDVVNSREDLVNNLAQAPRIRVVYQGVKPDTLVNEAHAIVTGKLAADGKFHAGQSPDALLLQCPTKYENAETASK